MPFFYRFQYWLLQDELCKTFHLCSFCKILLEMSKDDIMKINDFKIFSINSTHVMKYHSWFIKCTKSLNNESCAALGCLSSGWDFSCKTLPEMSQLDDYSCVTQGSFPTDSTALLPPPSPRWLNTLHFLKQLLEDIGRIYLAREREGGKGQSLSNTWLTYLTSHC